LKVSTILDDLATLWQLGSFETVMKRRIVGLRRLLVW
jgi:hypothetical protein